MDWDDLGELAQHGWEVGSHTCTHPRLTRLATMPSRMSCANHGGLRRPARAALPIDRLSVRGHEPARRRGGGRAGYETGARLSRDLRPSGPLSYPRVGLYHLDDWSRFRVKTAGTVRRLRASILI